MQSAKVMFGYAGFLAFCGVLAFTIAAVGGTLQYTALIPVGLGAIVAACGMMSLSYHKNRTVGMIGIHVGLVLPLLFGLLFSQMAYGRFTRDEPVYYLGTIFAVMAVGSFITLVLLLKLRPKPEDRGG